MEKSDYLKALKIPFILLIIYTVCVYLMSWFIYKDITAYEQLGSSLPSIALYSILLMIFSYGIIFYTGWIIVSKFNGDIKNSLIAGLIAGGIQIVLSIINTVLMYITISGYRNSYAPIEGLEGLSIMMILVGTIITIPFTLGIDIGIAALGGFISKKVNVSRKSHIN